MRKLLVISCLIAIFSGVYFLYKFQEVRKRRPANKIQTDRELPKNHGPSELVVD
ncbi:MAG: hypothetical protein OEY33_05895 [Bdellovibrionales bacterium]|nr:hypothetical protein [Bdellovibrionales bacterium]